MFNRYSIAARADEIASRFSVEVPSHFNPVYNAAPSQLLPIITSESPKGVSTFYWGLAPTLSNNKTVSEKLINLRSESILEKPVFRKALLSRRCIVPADGFYDWKKLGKKITSPYRFVLKDRSIFSLAGIWEEYEDLAGENYHTFSIITTIANDLVLQLNERMPAILKKAAEEIWLNKSASEDSLVDLLQPMSSQLMDSYPVSSRINSLANNDASLILRAPAQDQYGNLTLFG